MSLDFSILISTHNRAAALPKLIGHISRQDLGPYKGEVIIIDNASTDETAAVLARAECRIPLVHLSEPSPGKNKALNVGMKQARGELFIFTDDDVIPCEKWVFSIMEGARSWPEDCVFCGPIDLELPAHTPSWIRELPDSQLLPLYCRFRPASSESSEATDAVPFGANLAIRSRVFRDLDYDESVGPQGQVYAMGSETELLLDCVNRDFVSSTCRRRKYGTSFGMIRLSFTGCSDVLTTMVAVELAERCVTPRNEDGLLGETQ